MPRKKTSDDPQFTTTPLASPPIIEPESSTETPEPVSVARPAKPRRSRRPRQTKTLNLKKELKKIYSTEEGAPLDMSFFERKASRRKTKKFFLTLVVLALLSSLSWLGFFLFAPGQKFSEEKIKLTVEAPQNLRSASPVTIKIKYANDQKTPLGETFLTVRYPRGFKISQVAPAAANSENTEWNLGALTANNPGEIIITGEIFGAKDETLPLRIFLNYRPANFNAEFQKIVTHNLRLDGLPLEASFSGPTELQTGKTGDYEIIYKNNAEETLTNLLVKVSVPLGFKINKAEPAASGASQKTTEAEIFNFGPLSVKNAAEFKIKISGVFTGEALGGNKNFTAQLLLKNNDQLYEQSLISKTTELAAATFKLELVANDSADKLAIHFEDKINFLLKYENAGQTPLPNAVVRLILETPSVDNKSLLNWIALEDKNNGAVEGRQISSLARAGSITWTKKEIKNLAEIKPGDKGEISLMIPVKSRKDFIAPRLTNWHVKAYGELAAVSEPSNARQSNTLDLALTTDLALTSAATLKETKNQTSTYIIKWTLTNTLHEITDVTLAASLPENLTWVGLVSVSAGDLTFDKNTRQVSWVINRIPVSFPKTEISFAVSAKTPAEDQAATLLDKTRLTAKDKVTGEALLIQKEPMAVQ